jgi:hypothetical protein
MKKVILAILVVVAIGGGAVLLAQQADAAAPGDSLYSIDLLAEKVQRALIMDELKKAEFEGDILGERIAEYQSQLAKDGNGEDILKAVLEQQTRVRENIGAAENNPGNYPEDALKQAQERYEEQLQSHIETMEQTQNQGEDTALQVQVKTELKTNLDACRSGNCGSANATGQQGSTGNAGETGNGNN